jgi:hypothetical protein
MLLIILLSAIAQLVAVSADCHIDTTNRTISDWSSVSSSVGPINTVRVKVWKGTSP